MDFWDGVIYVRFCLSRLPMTFCVVGETVMLSLPHSKRNKNCSTLMRRMDETFWDSGSDRCACRYIPLLYSTRRCTCITSRRLKIKAVAQQILKYYGKLTPEIAIRYLTAVEMSGDNHLAYYDLSQMLIWVSFASPNGVGGAVSAYDRQFVKFNATLLFQESEPSF